MTRIFTYIQYARLCLWYVAVKHERTMNMHKYFVDGWYTIFSIWDIKMSVFAARFIIGNENSLIGSRCHKIPVLTSAAYIQYYQCRIYSVLPVPHIFSITSAAYIQYYQCRIHSVLFVSHIYWEAETSNFRHRMYYITNCANEITYQRTLSIFILFT